MSDFGGLDEGMEPGELKGDSSEGSLVIPDSEKELEELVTKRAGNTDDRYKILEARDKIQRLRNPKVKVRVEFAVRLTGSCPDMCPEKERYMREYQRRLAVFECLPGRDHEVDHQTAVKEYSRSSADQEEPLPHDLRPTSTLHLTFNYLLHYVISRVETEAENLGDWYYFVWDRTRSIRKDMTQQQLCDLEAVSLMEKCTRFHIYCSSRLCEMDRHAFDPKLNDENLMKCLQSLEHMYTDLNLKGVECPNEPEFRAYQILMNLNEGDILWETQQRPIRVLQAPQVILALKIHMAVYDKNFVSFFRLLDEVPYMTACLLHRYFFQIRANAIRSLVKAHTIPQKSLVTMPMDSAKRFLGYDDQSIQTFIYFCESHGITCDVPADSIVVRRRELTFPDTPIINREYKLIESKLKSSVSEAINGAPLDPFPNYVPYSSFEEKGYLKSELLAELMNMKKSVQTRPVTSNSPQLTTSTRNRIETKSPIPLPPVINATSVIRIKPQPVVEKPERSIPERAGNGKAFTASSRLFTNSLANVFGGIRPVSKENSGPGPGTRSTTGNMKKRLGPLPAPAETERIKPKKESVAAPLDAASIFGSKRKLSSDFQFPSNLETEASSTSNIFGTSDFKPISFGIDPNASGGSDSVPDYKPSVFGIKKESDVPDSNIFKSSVGGFSFKIKQEPGETSSIFGASSQVNSSPSGNLFTNPNFKSPAGSQSVFGNTEQGFSTPHFGMPSIQVPKTEPIGPDKRRVAAEVIHHTESQVVTKVVVEEVRQLSQEALKAVIREKEEEIRREKLKALRQMISVETLNKIEKRVICDLVSEVSEREIQRFELYEWLSIEVASDIFCDVVKEVVTQVSNETHAETVQQFEIRIHKAREALRRFKLRSLFLQWRTNAEEARVEREKRLEKQRYNLENFPPIVSFQLSPATILGSWFGFGSPIVHTKKLSLESPAMEFIERSVSLSKSFTEKLEENTPSVLDYLISNLMIILEEEEGLLESSLSHKFLPPVAFNLVLWSDFGPLDRLANWLWTSLSKDCVPTEDENLLAHAFRHRSRLHFLTFQKCTHLTPALSSDVSALIVFCRTEPMNLKRISESVKQPLPILMFNTSEFSEAQIRRSVNNRGYGSHLVDLCILYAEESKIIDDIPVLVDGLTWLSGSIPRPPPLSMPPLNNFLATLFESYFPIYVKRVKCPLLRFQEHNNLVLNLGKFLRTIETTWPGKPSRLVAEAFRIKVPVPQNDRLLENLLGLLWIEPPAEILQHFHETDLLETEYRNLMQDYVRSIYVPGTPSLRFMSSVSDFIARPWKGLHSVSWPSFLTICQQYKVESLERLLPTALEPVCVDLTELKKLGTPLQTTFCPNCRVLFNRKRSLPSDVQSMELVSGNKSARITETVVNKTSLLQDINDLMKQLRDEKCLSQVVEPPISTPL